MGRHQISATPAALDAFATTSTRRAGQLGGALGATRGRTDAIHGAADPFGIIDALVAEYPEAARQATASIDDLLEVLGRLGEATRAAAERFRKADA